MQGGSKKDYANWHNLKSQINESNRFLDFNVREIWWCSLGINIGFEQDGKNENFERPILILKKFNQECLLILPLTSSNKKGKYYFQFEHKDMKYSAILSQIRLVSSKRLLRRIRSMEKEEFIKIRNKIKKLF